MADARLATLRAAVATAIAAGALRRTMAATAAAVSHAFFRSARRSPSPFLGAAGASAAGVRRGLLAAAAGVSEPPVPRTGPDPDARRILHDIGGVARAQAADADGWGGGGRGRRFCRLCPLRPACPAPQPLPLSQ